MRFQLLFCRVQCFPRSEQNRLIFHLPLLLLRQGGKGSLRLLNGTFAVERYRAELFKAAKRSCAACKAASFSTCSRSCALNAS